MEDSASRLPTGISMVSCIAHLQRASWASRASRASCQTCPGHDLRTRGRLGLRPELRPPLCLLPPSASASAFLAGVFPVRRCSLLAKLAYTRRDTGHTHMDALTPAYAGPWMGWNLSNPHFPLIYPSFAVIFRHYADPSITNPAKQKRKKKQGEAAPGQASGFNYPGR